MKRDKPSKLVRWLFWLGVILVLSWIFLWSGFKANETIWRFKPSTPSPDAKKGGK